MQYFFKKKCPSLVKTCKYHKLLFITELVFSDNPKACGKILWVIVEGCYLPVGLQSDVSMEESEGKAFFHAPDLCFHKLRCQTRWERSA